MQNKNIIFGLAQNETKFQACETVNNTVYSKLNSKQFNTL